MFVCLCVCVWERFWSDALDSSLSHQRENTTWGEIFWKNLCSSFQYSSRESEAVLAGLNKHYLFYIWSATFMTRSIMHTECNIYIKLVKLFSFNNKPVATGLHPKTTLVHNPASWCSTYQTYMHPQSARNTLLLRNNLTRQTIRGRKVGITMRHSPYSPGMPYDHFRMHAGSKLFEENGVNIILYIEHTYRGLIKIKTNAPTSIFHFVAPLCLSALSSKKSIMTDVWYSQPRTRRRKRSTSATMLLVT